MSCESENSAISGEITRESSEQQELERQELGTARARTARARNSKSSNRESSGARGRANRNFHDLKDSTQKSSGEFGNNSAEMSERSSEVRDQTTPSSLKVGRNGEDFRPQERSNGATPTSREVGRDEENHSTAREVGRTVKTQRRGRTDQHRPHKRSDGTEVRHDLKRSGEP